MVLPVVAVAAGGARLMGVLRAIGGTRILSHVGAAFTGFSIGAPFVKKKSYKKGKTAGRKEKTIPAVVDTALNSWPAILITLAAIGGGGYMGWRAMKRGRPSL
jgi:hypothetical protein